MTPPRSRQAAATPAFIEPEGPTVRKEKITPELAREMLDANVENNRNLRDTMVEKYSRDMLAGRWEDNVETIKVDTNGKLIDGQHRIAAIIEAGIPVVLWVARGLSPDSIHTIDTGQSRKYADVLKLQGNHDVNVLGATLRRLFLWDRGVRMSRSAYIAPSPIELNEYLENSRVLIQLAIGRARDVRAALPPLTPTIGASAYFLFARIDAAKADQFFDGLATGANMDGNHPILRLRQRRNVPPQGRKYTPDEKLALVIRAWNHFREGNSVNEIVVTPKGALNDNNFPEPK